MKYEVAKCPFLFPVLPGIVTSLFFSLAVSQENYGQWTRSREISVNTSASGANVSATQTNYPLLVRLNLSNISCGNTTTGGADIRFAKLNGTHLPYQIERWDTANKAAEIWVLMDTVYGNNDGYGATNKIRMYSGKSGAVDSSDGGAVFDTSRGFQGVFHLGEATNDTARDATKNKFKGIPRNRGASGIGTGSNPADTIGLIGKAKKFLGDTGNNYGGSYRILTSTGGNTFDNNPLNFQNDSTTKNGIPQYTLSAWINIRLIPPTTTKRKAIIAKSMGANNAQYHMRLRDPAISNIYTPLKDTILLDFADGPSAVYKRSPPGFQQLEPWASSRWFYMAGIRSNTLGAIGNSRIYGFDSGDVFVGLSTASTTTTTIRSDYNAYIGSFSNDSGYFMGKLDEVRFENVARDSQWIKLNYETQKPGSTVVSVGTDLVLYRDLVYRTTTLVLTSGAAMIPDTLTITQTCSSAPYERFTISPALPAGLRLDSNTGVLSGTPTTTTGQVATSYTITASGPSGSATTILSIAINVAPVITSQPVTISYICGSPIRLGITASGLPAPTYKWIRQRGATIDTLTAGGIFSFNTRGDTLIITNAAPTDTGTYRCRALNVAGSAVSNNARLMLALATGNCTGSILDGRIVHNPGSNPFSYRIPNDGSIARVRMTVENMSRRETWSGEFEMGKSRVVSWNGTDHNGGKAPSGIYVVRLKLLSRDGGLISETREAGALGR